MRFAILTMLALTGATSASAAVDTAGVAGARAETAAHWVFDPLSRCYLYYFGGSPSDEVRWAGDCVSRVASGPGAAMFLYRGRLAEFVSAEFANGAAEGSVRIYWPDGARLDGQTRFGRLIGKGIMTFGDAQSDSRAGNASLSPTGSTSRPVAEAAKPDDPGAPAGVAKEPETTVLPAKPTAADAGQRAGRLQSIPVRQSVVHLIDDPAALVLADDGVGISRGDSHRTGVTRHAAQCLNVDSDGGEIGFRNTCAFPVRFAYCVAHATREDVSSCDTGPEGGEVRPDSFAALFDAFGQPDYDVRWIACDASTAHPVPRLIRTDPPAGQCLPRRLAAER